MPTQRSRGRLPDTSAVFGSRFVGDGAALMSWSPMTERHQALLALSEEICSCRACPRLVEWREKVAREKRASYRDETYWGRPVPGFGDPSARIAIVGLAPAAHGANRTGRVFTGDRSGDFLFASLHRVGMANQPESSGLDDGLELNDIWVTAAVRCAPPANKPTPAEREACRPWLQRELALLDDIVVYVCLGQFGYQVAATELGLRPRPKFGHGVRIDTPDVSLVCSFHPSQQNTFTGRLTPEMLDDAFSIAREAADERRPR